MYLSESELIPEVQIVKQFKVPETDDKNKATDSVIWQIGPFWRAEFKRLDFYSTSTESYKSRQKVDWFEVYMEKQNSLLSDS